MKIISPLFLRGSWATALLSVFAVVALSLSTGVSAAESNAPKKVEPFQKMATPQTTEAPKGKIEVVEFFSYLCGHCASFNPSVEEWKKKLPDDVVFYKIPVSWGKDQWREMTRVYYTLSMMGEEERLSPAVFDALHKERINLTDRKTFFDWVEKKGVDRKKLEGMFDSFAVNSKVMQADKKADDYKVQSVPHFFVNGLYEINIEAANSIPGVFDNINDVIAIARKEINKK